MDEDEKERGEIRDNEEVKSSPDGQNTPDYAATNGKKRGEEPCGQNTAEPRGAADKSEAPEGGKGMASDDGFFETDSGENASSHSGEERKGSGAARGKKRPFVLWQKPLPQKDRRKYSRSFQIALSAISCAIAVVFLTLGLLSNVLVATGYLIAQVALMVPLSKQFYLGDFLAYLGTVLLAVIFGAVAQFWNLVPFIMFFGLHPLANSFQLKYRVNRWVALVVKMVWFDVTLYVMYLLVFGGVLGASAGESAFFDFVNEYIWLFIIVLGSLFLWLYDYIMFKVQIWINMLVYRIKK